LRIADFGLRIEIRGVEKLRSAGCGMKDQRIDKMRNAPCTQRSAGRNAEWKTKGETNCTIDTICHRGNSAAEPQSKNFNGTRMNADQHG
jgi:hypothetical protein